MATGFTALQDLKECPVCREEFTDPRALPCDHLLCQDCVDHIRKGIQIKCPVCNTSHDVRKVRRDFRLMQFLDALKEDNKLKQNKQADAEPYCQVCSSDEANYWCKECQQWMCNGCNRSHPNIPACRNHQMEPISKKINEIKSHYTIDAKAIQAKIKNYTSAAENIEEKISELEMTQLESLEASSGLRKKCHDDIDQFFDSIDAQILTFIGEKITQLECSRTGLASELKGLETKWNQLEKMIKEDSRKLVVDGQAILNEAKQMNVSHSEFEVKYDNITIQLVQGPEWKPSSAALLKMLDNAQITSLSQMSKIQNKMASSNTLDARPASPSKPCLSVIANKQYKRTNGVELKNSPWTVRFLDNKLWVGMENRVDIFDLNLKRITTWTNDAWSFVNDVVGLPDSNFLLVCYNGMFHVDSYGEEITKIDSGDYKSGAYHDGKLYVYEYKSNSIIIYAYNSSWKKLTTVQSPVKKGYNTLSISDTTIHICSADEHRIYSMNHAGHVLHTYGTCGPHSAGELNHPYLCQENDDGVLLVADYRNNRLQVLDKQQQWRIVNLEPVVHGPHDAVYVNNVIYVVSRSDKKLYLYKAT